MGEVSRGLFARADVYGACVGAVEVRGAWWGVGEGEVGLAFGDYGSFVFAVLVDDGLECVLEKSWLVGC